MRKIIDLYFSPTGNCKKIGTFAGIVLSEKMNCPVEFIDMTDVEHRDRLPVLEQDDFLIVTMPVYAGRLPNKIMPVLKEMLDGKHTHAPALAMVTYGNRNYDDALSELCLLLKESGCVPVAAAAFPCEHAFSSKIAGGRPNDEDMAMLEAFMIRLSECSAENRENISVEVPGNDPPGAYYIPLGKDGLPAKFLKAKPKLHPEFCIGCGRCARQCPMGAINSENVEEIPGTCIKCQACVRNCPRQARYFDDEAFLSHVAMLEDFAAARKEIEFFE